MTSLNIGIESAIVGGVASVAVAIVAGLMAYLNGRTKNKVDVQKTLNESFGALINELQEERVDLMKERHSLQQTVMQQDRRILDLEKRINRLLVVTTQFHTFIVQEGLTPPPFNENDVLLGNTN